MRNNLIYVETVCSCIIVVLKRMASQHFHQKKIIVKLALSHDSTVASRLSTQLEPGRSVRT